MRPRLFAIRTHFCHSNSSASFEQFPLGFSFWPRYFSLEEQETLLAASLHKLDATEKLHSRRRRKDYWSSRAAKSRDGLSPLTTLFAPDAMYDFQEACP